MPVHQLTFSNFRLKRPAPSAPTLHPHPAAASNRPIHTVSLNCAHIIRPCQRAAGYLTEMSRNSTHVAHPCKRRALHRFFPRRFPKTACFGTRRRRQIVQQTRQMQRCRQRLGGGGAVVVLGLHAVRSTHEVGVGATDSPLRTASETELQAGCDGFMTCSKPLLKQCPPRTHDTTTLPPLPPL